MPIGSGATKIAEPGRTAGPDMPRISFYLNHDRVDVDAGPVDTALDLVRGRLGLTGTKESCGRGDCGSCTVALGTARGDRIDYRAVCSCILPAARLHGRHVVTVEGLNRDSGLHPIQQALVDNHAVQCGFCTPGIVMSLFCLLTGDPEPGPDRVDAALEGNLCRCTGYESIRRAALQLADPDRAGHEHLLPDRSGELPGLLAELPERPGPDDRYLVPGTVEELCAALDRDGTRIIGGGTDLVPELRGAADTPVLVDITGIDELGTISRQEDGLLVGAGVTLSRLLEDSAVREHAPVLADTISRMASAQVRNVATLAGNLANASPVADAAVLLLALDARLRLVSRRGERTVPVEGFYRRYKTTCLEPGEFVAAVEIPRGLPLAGFRKTGKRRSVDIASANSALALSMDGEVVGRARLALGGVAETPVIATRAARHIEGRKPDLVVARETARIAAEETSPIDDVRGSARFRRQLVRGQVISILAGMFPDSLGAG